MRVTVFTKATVRLKKRPFQDDWPACLADEAIFLRFRGRPWLSEPLSLGGNRTQYTRDVRLSRTVQSRLGRRGTLFSIGAFSMSYADNPYEAPQYTFAAEAAADERASFITKTYLHLAGAVVAFIAITAGLLQLPIAQQLTESVLGTQYGYLIVLVGFMAVSWVANSWASSSTSVGMQYAGLGLYVVAESIFFVPILYIAHNFFPDDQIIPQAGLTTLVLFAGLTCVVFLTRKDFSFLRGILGLLGFAAMAYIIAALIFGFSIGLFFTVAMIAFACGYILYDTSNVLHHYRIGQHVAASLALFASVALLFWYVLQLFMSRD